MRAASRLAVLAMLVAALAAPAGASEVSAGFDLFESQPGTTADLTSLHPSCPAAVPLEGVPLVPASLGNTDTIVERFAGSGSPFDPPAAMVTVPIELVALHLVSATPVDLSCAGGLAAVDLHLTVNKGGIIAGLPQPDVLMPSIGSMEIRHDLGPGAGDDFGGGFDSCFGEASEAGHSPPCDTLGVAGGGVFANAIFTVPGGDPSEPADVVSSAPADRVALSSTGGTWLHIPAPGYPLDPAFPAGAFFVQTLPHIGPHPVEPAKVVEATKVDSLTSVGGASGDTDADGVADPGETVSYTVEITGLGDAADVTLDDTIDANSTLVGGSVQITPIAFDDFYELTAAMLTVPAATGVLLNDVDPDHSTMPGTNAGLTAVSLDVMGTSGTVSNFMPDGSFEYEPAMGFSGLDSFQYTARDEDSLDSVVTGVVVIDVKNTPPTATDDSYDSLGNTLLEVTLDHAGVASTDNTVVTQPSVIGDTSPAKTYRSVFENDTDTEDTDKNDLTAAVVGGTVTAGAIVTMFDDGTFEYTPPAGFTGPDTFDYTVTDTGGLMDTGTVTINVSGRIWYVDKDNAGTADGRSATPFASLAPLDAGGAADASDGSGDTIFVFDESAGNTSGGILLEANQILHGNGVALDPAGFEYAGGGDLVAAATAPTIEDAAGDVVELVNGNTVRGLDIAATNGRAIFGSNTAGAIITDVGTTGTGSGTGVRFDNATGTIAISDLDVASSTDSGIDIQGGSATFTFDSLSSITDTGAPAFNVNGGTAQVTYSGSITQGNNFPAVAITGHSNGAGSGITFQTGAISATNGSGLQFSNADGTYDFDGATTLNGGGTNDTGIDILSGSAGTFTFANTSITNPTGAGLNIDGSTAAVTWSGGAGISKNNAGAAVNVNNHSSGAVNIGVNINASGAGAGTGLQFSNADGTYNFNTMTGTTTLNGGDAGIDILSGSNGTFTFGSNTTITDPTGHAFNLDTSTGGNVTYNGTISKTNTASPASAVRVNAKTGGSVTFTGAITGNTATANAIDLTSNAPGGSITFSGLLDLDTTSGFGFRATGGGTVQATNAGNTVTTVGDGVGFGVGVNIGAGIGALGVTFNTVDVGSSGKAGSGIVLANTGSVGTFTVTGGTIQNTNNRGFDAANVDGTVSVGASIQNDGGRSVDITGSEGQFTFSGAINEDAQGINISSNNTGSPTFTFKGGIDVDTFFGNNIGFHAFSGGTLQVCADTNCNGTGTALVNTIDTTTGTGSAIVVDLVTIGAAGLTFRSIDVDDGVGPGINLDSTGAGTFTVTGINGPCGHPSTTDCDGGTLANIQGDAVRLQNTGGRVTLKNMLIENIGSTTGGFDTKSGHDAIHGEAVAGGLTLESVTIRKISDMAVNGSVFTLPASNNPQTTWVGLEIKNSLLENTNRFDPALTTVADDSDEGMVRIVGLSGTVLVDGSKFNRGGTLFQAFVPTGTLDITITENDFLTAYKEFTSGGVLSKGISCVDLIAQGTGNIDAVIGDLVNTTVGHQSGDKGNLFLNCHGASVRVANDSASVFAGGPAAHTGSVDAVLGNNTFRSNDHDSAQSGDFDFPRGYVLLFTRGTDSATYDARVSRNLFDEISFEGGLGSLTLDLEDGQHQVLAEHNTFDSDGHQAWFVRADSSQSAVVKFANNIGIRGPFCSGDPSAAGGGCNLGAGNLCPSTGENPSGEGYCGPGENNIARPQNGGDLDLVFSSESPAAHDVAFDPGSTISVESVSGAGNNVCVHFENSASPHGYRLDETTGTIVLQGSGATPTGSCAPEAGGTPTVTDANPATCITVMTQNGNTGGAGAPAGSVDIDVINGTVTVVSPVTSACAQPTGGIF